MTIKDSIEFIFTAKEIAKIGYSRIEKKFLEIQMLPKSEQAKAIFDFAGF